LYFLPRITPKQPAPMPPDDATLLAAVRRGEAAAWETLIARYQGRLLAFVQRRLNDQSLAEDLVQETFLGFVLALPNYQDSTPLESFLFSIAAHKLTDALRRQGRRPMVFGVASGESSSPGGDPVGQARKASSLARSRESHQAIEQVLGDCLRRLAQTWFSQGEFERLACVELLLVKGWPNKDVARQLDIPEQAVANHKQFALQKLKAAATAARLRDINWGRLEN